jgi:hypothetical protein
VRWWSGAIAGVLMLAACTDAGGDVRLPPRDVRFDYQLGGAYPAAEDVGVVVRDRTDAPDPDRYSVCYVNAFQTQPGADDVPERLLLHDEDGARVEDPGWPDEHLLDISTQERRAAVLDVVGPWFDGCADDGFDAVEPDNLDSWTRSGGALDRADAAAMARLLVTRAHARGLAIAQKNAAELTEERLGFDFAVVEDCQAFAECASYAAAYGVVLDVEYDDVAFAEACAAATDGVSVQRRDLPVGMPGSAGYVARWCER